MNIRYNYTVNKDNASYIWTHTVEYQLLPIAIDKNRLILNNQANQKYCTNCGTKIKNAWIYCSNCGTKIDL